jgi:hypothetical protein
MPGIGFAERWPVCADDVAHLDVGAVHRQRVLALRYARE